MPTPTILVATLGDADGTSVGALIIRIGFGGLYYTIIILRNPQNPILIIKAPTFIAPLNFLPVSSAAGLGLTEQVQFIVGQTWLPREVDVEN